MQNLRKILITLGTWAALSFCAQTVATAQVVRVPLSDHPTQSSATNIISQLVADIDEYSTNSISASATALANHVSLAEEQDVGNKTLTNSVFGGGTITNAMVLTVYLNRANGETNNAIYFYDSGGNVVSAIAPNDDGNPSLYIAESFEYPLTDELSLVPGPEEILNAAIADFRYGQLAAANAWAGTNTFTQITNSSIVGSTLTGNTYSGTISSLSGGSISGVTLTSSIFTGGFGNITSGTFFNIASTNLTATNTTLKGVTQVVGGMNYQRANHTALANGANAAVDFGDVPVIKIKAGPTAAFSIAGIANGANGKAYRLINATGQDMTISYDSGGDPTAANRIYTTTAADISCTGNGMFDVWYDSEDSRWWAAKISD